MAGPLDGIKVVDITQGIAGPYCSMVLGDAGAEVIKVEPLAGDCARGYGPPFIGDESALFLGVNRNKQSLGLDITTAPGRHILLKLVENADLFLADLTPDEAQSLQLGYAQLEDLNRRLVYCSITPFGERGPLANLPGAEVVIQAMADYTNSLGAIGEPPVRLGADVANTNGGGIAVQGIVAALLQRERSGRGQKVSVSLFGSLLHMRGMIWACQSEGVDDWWGFHQDTYVKPPDHGYTTRNGQIFFTLGGTSEEAYAELIETLGLSHTRNDPRWGNSGRDVAGGPSRYGWEVKPVWEEAMKDRTSEELTELIKQHGGVAVPLNNYESLFAHPQVAEIGMVQEVEHPTAGRTKVTGIPWSFSATPGRIKSPPPLLGQHTDEILSALGYTEADREALRRQQIIA